MTVYTLVGPIKKAKFAETTEVTCAECGYEDLKNGLVLAATGGNEIAVGPGCGVRLLGWAPAKVANAAKSRPTLDTAVVARLESCRDEVAGSCETGDCDLCYLPVKGRRVAINTADGGTAATHLTCAARAYTKVMRRRVTTSTIRLNVDAAMQGTPYGMAEYSRRNRAAARRAEKERAEA